MFDLTTSAVNLFSTANERDDDETSRLLNYRSCLEILGNCKIIIVYIANIRLGQSLITIRLDAYQKRLKLT